MLDTQFSSSASGLTIEFVEGSLDVELIQLTFGVSFVCPLHPCCHFVPSPLNTDPPLDISNGSHQEVQGRQDLRVYQLQVAARCQEWKGGLCPRLDSGPYFCVHVVLIRCHWLHSFSTPSVTSRLSRTSETARVSFEPLLSMDGALFTSIVPHDGRLSGTGAIAEKVPKLIIKSAFISTSQVDPHLPKLPSFAKV